jgi:FkbM family methyltransferase
MPSPIPIQFRFFRDLCKWLLYPFYTRIRSGPLAGKRWIIATGSKFIAGTYEPEKTAAITRLVSAGNVAYDIGAHVGYYSILMADLAGDEGAVYAFEPRPINYAFLNRHIRLNYCRNIRTYRMAIGKPQGQATPGTARLETRTGTGTGHLSETGTLLVAVTSIDECIAARHGRPPDLLKIDVEGGELDVLHGASRTLDEYHPRLIVATHSYPLDAACRDFLLKRGYTAEILDQEQGDRETIYTYSAPAQV